MKGKKFGQRYYPMFKILYCHNFTHIMERCHNSWTPNPPPKKILEVFKKALKNRLHKIGIQLEWLRTFKLYYKILSTIKMCISLLTYLRFLCILDMFIYRISLIHVQNKKCQRWYIFYKFRKNLYQKNIDKRRKRGNVGKRKIRWHYHWPESLQKPWHFLNWENRNQ